MRWGGAFPRRASTFGRSAFRPPSPPALSRRGHQTPALHSGPRASAPLRPQSADVAAGSRRRRTGERTPSLAGDSGLEAAKKATSAGPSAAQRPRATGVQARAQYLARRARRRPCGVGCSPRRAVPAGGPARAALPLRSSAFTAEGLGRCFESRKRDDALPETACAVVEGPRRRDRAPAPAQEGP